MDMTNILLKIVRCHCHIRLRAPSLTEEEGEREQKTKSDRHNKSRHCPATKTGCLAEGSLQVEFSKPPNNKVCRNASTTLRKLTDLCETLLNGN